MTFTEFLRSFAEPGFVFTLMVAFTLAYFVALKANPLWQIGLCIFFASYAATEWSNGVQWTLAMGWVYCGWAGYAFQKIGGGALLSGLTRRIRNRFQNWSHSPSIQENRPSSPPPRNPNRQEGHQRQQEEFQRRERERTRRQKSQKEQSRPKPEPEQKPPPEPKKKPDPTPPSSKPRNHDWWEVLEVPANSDVATIKKAYRTMIQKYHPDRVSHLGVEFQEIAERKAKEINAAYSEAIARF